MSAASVAGGFGRGLFSRIALSVVIGFVLLHIAGFYFYGHERMVENARTFAISVADRAVQLDEVLATQPELLPLLQSASFKVARIPQPVSLDASPGGDTSATRWGRNWPQEWRNKQPVVWPHNEEVVQVVLQRLRAGGVADEAMLAQVQVAYVSRPGSPRLYLQMPSRGGGFLQIIARTEVTHGADRGRAGTFMTLFLILVIGLVLYVTRRFTRQLGRFSDAAESLGRGQAGRPLPERVGPGELRRASAAFNRMQAKVMGLLAERADMLAGVSHDLRTLCTRLGLRLEYISDPAQQDKAQRDIGLMTDILDQALTFARDEHSDEVFDQIDVSTLLESLCHALQDQGHAVTFSGPDHLVIRAQRLAITRLFANLIDNALKYGGAALVELTDEAVTVTDPGEGFSEAQEAAALSPYHRLESARSQNLPGTGLGLAIADNVCRRHHWGLYFDQVTDGFQVTVEFA